MRTAAYVAGSMVLASAVFIAAFEQHPTFYSAVVYLSQSNFCLMILLNFAFLVYFSIMNGLRHICYGPLRAVEFEQLTDRAWIVTTETLLAMTVFREEIGAYFLMMFTALITGKIWSWIAEGRLETLEQQPPANPRLFHTRLIMSLAVSALYDVGLLKYAISVVIQQSRPTMMVMYMFEFAVLLTTTSHTILRYLFIALESYINKEQTRSRLEERRNEVWAQAERIQRARAENPDSDEAKEEIPDPNDIEEMDIEVPGWEGKGQYLLFADLITDFVKFMIYIAFFSMIFAFYGLPVHILRDIYMTGASFFRRIALLLKYRRAVQNINQYADATAEDLAREDTCIICRDSMRAWNPDAPSSVERTRPKKLPCGHILHHGCLKNWLERQQVCPTCRRPVTQNSNTNATNNNNNNNNHNRGAAGNNVARPGLPADWNAFGGPAGAANNGAGAPGAAEQPNDGLREYQLGPLRFRFQVRQFVGDQAIQQANAHQQAAVNGQAAAPAIPGPAGGAPALNDAQEVLARIRDQGQAQVNPNQTGQNTAPPVVIGHGGGTSTFDDAQAILARLRAQGSQSTHTQLSSQQTTSNQTTPTQATSSQPPAAQHPAPSTQTSLGSIPTPTTSLPNMPYTSAPTFSYRPLHPQMYPMGSLAGHPIDLNTIRAQVRQTTEALNSHIAALQVIQQEVNINNMLVAEIARLQNQQANTAPGTPGPSSGPTSAPNPFANTSAPSFQSLLTNRTFTPPPGTHSAGPSRQTSANPLRTGIPAGSSELPPGLVLPTGWTFTPIAKPEAAPTPTPFTAPPSVSAAPSVANSVRSVSRSRSPVRSRAMLAALHNNASFSNLHAASSAADVPVVAPSPLSAGTTSSLLRTENVAAAEGSCAAVASGGDVKGKGITVSDAEDEEA